MARAATTQSGDARGCVCAIPSLVISLGLVRVSQFLCALWRLGNLHRLERECAPIHSLWYRIVRIERECALIHSLCYRTVL